MKHQLKKARTMRAARGQLGLTRHDLARRVRCTESKIGRIETGREVPDERIKQRIADALGKPTFELFDISMRTGGNATDKQPLHTEARP